MTSLLLLSCCCDEAAPVAAADGSSDNDSGWWWWCGSRFKLDCLEGNPVMGPAAVDDGRPASGPGSSCCSAWSPWGWSTGGRGRGGGWNIISWLVGIELGLLIRNVDFFIEKRLLLKCSFVAFKWSYYNTSFFYYLTIISWWHCMIKVREKIFFYNLDITGFG